MAGQGWFLKFIASPGAKNFLNANRISINYQPQQCGMKQAAVEKLKQLNIPEKPKKPVTAYFRYMMENRESILRKNPHFKLIDVSKQCSADWAQINETLKEKYITEYKRDLEVYNKKHAEFMAKLSKEQLDGLKEYAKEKSQDKKKRELRKKFKETNRPKRPLGAFMLYLMDVAEKENKKINELMQSIKGKWAELPENEKKKYMIAAEERKKHYEIEMEQWESRMIREGHEDIIRKKALPSKRPSRLRDQKAAKGE